MGDLIVLAERRDDRSRPSASGSSAFFFDLACPFSYLAAEQVDRSLQDASWVPVSCSMLDDRRTWRTTSRLRHVGSRGRIGSWPPAGSRPRVGSGGLLGSGRAGTRSRVGSGHGEPEALGQGQLAQLRAEAELRALELRLPLVWPDRFPSPVPSALRAAAYAAEVGAGDRFALAASRLAFCGGFDLEDLETLAEAAAAAGIPLDPCLAAARDSERDRQLDATARGLASRGVTTLPAVRLDQRWFEGVGAPAQAAGIIRMRAMYEGCEDPLAPRL